MDKEKLNQVSFGLRAFFEDDEIPEEFSWCGQSFIDRCEGWALHALGQLEDELEVFKEEGDCEADDVI